MSILVLFIIKISIFEGRLCIIDFFDNRESDVFGFIFVDLFGGIFIFVYFICYYIIKRKWEFEFYIE